MDELREWVTRIKPYLNIIKKILSPSNCAGLKGVTHTKMQTSGVSCLKVYHFLLCLRYPTSCHHFSTFPPPVLCHYGTGNPTQFFSWVMSSDAKKIGNILSRKQFYFHLSRTSESDKSSHDMKGPLDKLWFLLVDKLHFRALFCQPHPGLQSWKFYFHKSKWLYKNRSNLFLSLQIPISL